MLASACSSGGAARTAAQAVLRSRHAVVPRRPPSRRAVARSRSRRVRLLLSRLAPPRPPRRHAALLPSRRVVALLRRSLPAAVSLRVDADTAAVCSVAYSTVTVGAVAKLAAVARLLPPAVARPEWRVESSDDFKPSFAARAARLVF